MVLTDFSIYSILIKTFSDYITTNIFFEEIIKLIKMITVTPIKLPLINPFVVTYASYTDMPSVIVKLEMSDGTIGYGEAVPDQHVTGETWQGVYDHLVNYLGPAIIGESPFNIERIHEKMDTVIIGNSTAKAAIDIACYDLMGKLMGQPVYRLLGGKYHLYLEVPFVLGIDSPEVMAIEAAKAVSKGYKQLKVKVGTDPKTDIERIRMIRQSVGGSISIRADANQGWKKSSVALSVLREVENMELSWIEQPVLADDIQGLSEVRQKSTIPVMADEALHGIKEMRHLIKKEATDLINIKLMKSGGIYPSLKLVAQAEMAGMDCIIGSMIESSIATAAGAHLAIAKKQIVGNELGAPLIFSKDISSLNYQKNQLFLNEEPGLGLTVNEAVIEELMIKSRVIN